MESASPFLSPLAVDKSELPSLRQSSSPPLDQSIEAVEAESEEEVTSEDVENHRQGHDDFDVRLLLGSLFGQRMHFLKENLNAFPRPSAHFNTKPDPNLSLTIDDHDSLSDSDDLKGKGKERAKSPKQSPVPSDSFFYLNVFDQMRLSMERNRQWRLYEEQDLERHMEIAYFESEDEVPLRNTLHRSAWKPEFIPGPSRITLDEL